MNRRSSSSGWDSRSPMPHKQQPDRTDIEAWRAIIKASDDAMIGFVAMVPAVPASTIETLRRRRHHRVRFAARRPSPTTRTRRSTSTSTAARSSWVAAKHAARSPRRTRRCRGCTHGRSITAWRPTTHTPPRSTIASRSTAGCSRSSPPERIVVGGGSAGGNLAAALMLRARDEGLPFPAALVLLTPEADLTESGDSFKTNLGIDCVLQQSLAEMSALYAGDHDLTDPYLSPLFGDYTPPFPPTFIQAGTRDLFLSNAVRTAPEDANGRSRRRTARLRGDAPRRILRRAGRRRDRRGDAPLPGQAPRLTQKATPQSKQPTRTTRHATARRPEVQRTQYPVK